MHGDDLNTAGAIGATSSSWFRLSTWRLKELGILKEFAGKALEIIHELADVLGVLPRRRSSENAVGEDIQAFS